MRAGVLLVILVSLAAPVRADDGPTKEQAARVAEADALEAKSAALLLEGDTKLDEAAAAAAEALDIKRRVLGKRHPRLASACRALASVYEARAGGEPRLYLLEPALALHDEAMKHLAEALVPDVEAVITSQLARGRLLHRLLQHAQSARAYAEALRVMPSGTTQADERVARALEGALDAYAEAPAMPSLVTARRALAAWARPLVARIAKRPDAPGTVVAQAHHLLGRCLSGSRPDSAEAHRAFERAQAGYAEHLGPSHRQTCHAWFDWAMHHFDCGDLVAMQAPFAKGLAAHEASGRKPGPGSLRPYPNLVNYPLDGGTYSKHVLDGGWLCRDDLPRVLLEEQRVDDALEQLHLGTNRPDFLPAMLARQARQLGEAHGDGSAQHLAALSRYATTLASFYADLPGAEAVFRDVLAHLEARSGAPKTALADVLFDIGIVRYFRWDFQDAGMHLERAQRLYEEVHGIEHLLSASLLPLIGICAARSGAADRAAAFADRVLGLLRDATFTKWLAAKGSEGARRDVCAAAWTLCTALGRHADRRFLEATTPAVSLNVLASPLAELEEQGRYAELVARWRRPTLALVYRDSPVGERSLENMPGFVPALGSLRLAEALLDAGAYDEAYVASDDALKALGHMPIHLHLYQHHLHADLRGSTLFARTLLQRGLVDEALAVAVHAHRMEQLIPAWIQLTQGDVYGVWAVGKRQTPFWRPTIEYIWSTLAHGEASEVHARALEACEEPEEARRVMQGAVERAGARLGAQHPRRAELLHALAGLQLRMGDVAAARARGEEALRIFEQGLGADHPSVAGCHVTLGDVHLLLKEPAKARTHYERALVITEAVLFDAHENHVRARSGLALALLREGKPQAALIPMREALDRLLARVEAGARGTTSPERMGLIATTHWIVANWLEVARGAEVDGYAEVLRLRGLAARLMAHDERTYRRADPKARAKHEELRQAQARLARLVRLRPRPIWQRLVWRKAVAERTEEVAALTKQLARLSRPYTQTMKREAEGLKPVQKALRKGEALVDVLAVGGRYTAWVLARKGDPTRIELGDAEELDDLIGTFRDAVRVAETPSEEELQEAGAELRAGLWAPIAAALPEGTKTIYLVPDGSLAAAPLLALPGRESGTIIADEYLIAYLAYPQELLAPPGRKKTSYGLVVVGAVDYDNATRDPSDTGPVVTGRPLADIPNGTGRFSHLPATRDEAEWVKKEVSRSSRKGKVVHLVGPDATESALRRAVPGKAIVHLATHGYVNGGLDGVLRLPQGERYRLQPGLERHVQRFDPFLLSGLVLAGANARVIEGVNDGILTALEATHLDLDATELVVLSACESAKGIDRAGEGTIGLARGFALAGAKNVVGSLWKIGDEATRAFMEAFYTRYLDKRSIPASQALRDAMKALRSGARGDKLRAPKHWAAFVAYGPIR